MLKKIVKELMKPIIKEVYEEGYRDGERRMLEMYRYGWEVGHADTLAVLGAIDIEELDEGVEI